MSSEAYVQAGFLSDLLKNWEDAFPNDEWGEYLEALTTLARRGLTAHEEVSLQASHWALDELKHAHDEDWWDTADEDDEARFEQARLQTEETIEYWTERAKSFKGDTALAQLVTWIRVAHPWLWPHGTKEELARVAAERRVEHARRALATAEAELQRRNEANAP